MVRIIFKLLATVAAAFFASVGHAQEPYLSVSMAVMKWADTNNVVVLPGAQKAALHAAATEFGSIAVAAGVSPADANHFGRSISEGADIAATQYGLIGKWDSGEVELQLADPKQAVRVKSALTYELVSLQLRSLPRIYIVVEPVPPRDYVILINDQRSRARERNEEVFAVEPGPVTVLVKRKDKPDCTWKGELALGDEQPVHCKM